jgi:hypothetical protein
MNKSGFSTTAAIFVIATIMSSVLLASSSRLIAARGATVSLEDNLAAQYLAEGCAEVALLKLGLNPLYAGNETVTIGSESCTIRPVLLGVPTTIETEATKNSRTYRLRIELLLPTPLVVNSWRRVAEF